MGLTDNQQQLINQCIAAFVALKKKDAEDAGEYDKKTVTKISDDDYSTSEGLETDKDYKTRIKSMEAGWEAMAKSIYAPAIPLVLTYIENNFEVPVV